MPTLRKAVLPLLMMLGLPGLLRADPPDRVARLSYFSGSVSFRPAALDDWAEASTTYPLTLGDHLWTDDDSRGEIRVGRSSVVRLGPFTAFSFLNLDDDTTQMRMSEGTLAVTVRQLDENEVVEVDTPNAAVSLLRPGFYRVSVDQDGYQTSVSVRDGEVEVTAGGSAVPVYAGEMILVSGDGDSQPRYDIRDARGPDAWEDWCVDRDRRDERLESRRYVSPQMVGYEDLDDYGRWRDDPEYGHVWAPVSVAVNWAPYRYGRWAFVAPWGWTWVDQAPWGFAPFHYGRWARRSWGWCWVPGTIVARPVYAPALVAFVGGNDWFASLSIGGSGIGWFPLGPHEIYVPPYQVSPTYIRNLNVTNVTNINQINVTNINVTNITYVNQNVAGAVTAVNRETFVRGRAVDKAAVVVPAANVRRAKVRAAVVDDVKPEKDSVVGEATRRAARRPPAKVQDRQVVTRVEPPQRPSRAVSDASPAPEPRALTREKKQGQQADLKPVREGLPKPHEVRTGERPRPLGPADTRRERRATDPPNARPSAQPEQDRARDADRQHDRSKERPPTATPRPNDREREQPRATPRPDATPAPDSDRQRERERDADQQRERERPKATPEPDADRQREREREADQQRERERPKATPAPEDRQHEREPRERATPRPTPTPAPAREREKKEEAKPKPKPTPTPTPTPTPKPKHRDG